MSIDDFGTCYSALAYLKRLPVDRLKLDRSFVSGLGVNDDDHAIAQAVVSMAKALGLREVAEGVETALPPATHNERKSVEKGKSVPVRVDIGGRGISHKKKQIQNNYMI